MSTGAGVAITERAGAAPSARDSSIPPMAWVLSGAVALALAALVVHAVVLHGQGPFYTEGDAFYFRATAQDPFGLAREFVGPQRLAEAPYRYGRIGLPVLAWIFALGRPGWVGWSLIAVSAASIAAIPGIGAVLLADAGAPPAAAAVVLLAPGLLLNYGHPYADPLLVALLLLACVLEGRGRRPGALAVLAAAILVKEVAAIALVPLFLAALVRRDRRGAAMVAGAAGPYLMWCLWVRVRLGAFPFLAHTYSRSGALSFPLVGIAQALGTGTPNIGVVMGCVVVTVVLGAIASWMARGTLIGVLTLAYTALALCLGENAMAFLLENARVIAVAQVLALLSIVVAVSARRHPSTLREHGLFVPKPYL